MAILPHPELITRIQEIGTQKVSLSGVRLAVLAITAGAFICLLYTSDAADEL